MTDIRAFIYENSDVRIVQIDGQPWWVLKDICGVFGETNYRRVAARLASDVKGVSQVHTNGGKQNMIVVSEAGVYSALLSMQPSKARGVSDEYIAKR